MPMNIPLRATLQAGKTAFGVWNTLASPAAVRTMAGTPGISVSLAFLLEQHVLTTAFKWVLIDAEHGQINVSL